MPAVERQYSKDEKEGFVERDKRGKRAKKCRSEFCRRERGRRMNDILESDYEVSKE